MVGATLDPDDTTARGFQQTRSGRGRPCPLCIPAREFRSGYARCGRHVMVSFPVLGRGTQIGPYHIVEQVGRGGMATVYRAAQPSLNRFVALKVLAPHLALDPDFAARFRHEASLSASLEHPGIVPVYDVGDAEGVLYIAMRFVPGITLAQLIRQRSPVPLAHAVGILWQIAAALDFAHARGVVHRDVNPYNVLVEPGDRVSLVNFGIAHAGDSQRVTGLEAMTGTPTYMAPEQALGQTTDAR